MTNLLKEKNLRDIYIKSRAIPISRFNIFFSLTIGLIFFITIFISNLSISDGFNKINDLSSFLFSSLLSILGFLIAGYTIFCTITPLDLQKKMINSIDSKTRLPFFKKVHFIFIRVFIYFLIFSFFLFIIFTLKDIPLGLSRTGLSIKTTNIIYKYTNYSILTIIVTSTTFLFCELSSFIFNIYNSIATTLHWLITNPPQDKNK